MKKLVSSRQLEPDVLEEIFHVARYMRRVCDMKGRTDLLNDKIVGLIFLEPSSRTMLSFQSAAQRLGAGILFMQGKGTTSFEKGESVEDAIKVVGSYCDLIVARLREAGDARLASDVSDVPFINAGDGGNEHPTQSLIDAFTIQEELGGLANRSYCFGFDPLQSRSIHSLCLLLSRYSGITMTFVSPPELQLPVWLREELTRSGVTVHETTDINACRAADVIYVNRLQEERFSDPQLFEQYRYHYRLTASMISPANRIILDPLPRIDEISTCVDPLPVAAYFRQAKNGIYVRMALLTKMLDRV